MFHFRELFNQVFFLNILETSPMKFRYDESYLITQKISDIKFILSQCSYGEHKIVLNLTINFFEALILSPEAIRKFLFR